MAEFLNSHTTSIFISRPADHVYDHMARARRVAHWEPADPGRPDRGLVLTDEDGALGVFPLFDRDWLVLDQIVAIEPYDEMLIAQRLVPNGEGAELIVTMFQPERMGDDAFRELIESMELSMKTIKRIMEMQGRFEDRPMRARSVSVFIDRDPASVFEFVSQIRSLPQWAMQFIRSMSRPRGGWSAAPRGSVRVRLRNNPAAGIADQRIIPEPGREFLVPLRVLPNNAGAEVAVTMFQPEEMPDHVFDKMADMLGRELEVLRDLLKLRGFEKAA